MDSLTLSVIILIFILSLGLHFATARPEQPIHTTPPPNPTPVKNTPLILVHPAVLRQNVAVARLMRLECVIRGTT